MSGGSYSYTCYRVEDEYVGRTYDKELNDLIKDLVKVLHDLEWWQSSDISEESYRETLKNFKEKWLKQYNKDTCYNYCKYKELTKHIKQNLKIIEDNYKEEI